LVDGFAKAAKNLPFPWILLLRSIRTLLMSHLPLR